MIKITGEENRTIGDLIKNRKEGSILMINQENDLYCLSWDRQKTIYNFECSECGNYINEDFEIAIFTNLTAKNTVTTIATSKGYQPFIDDVEDEAISLGLKILPKGSYDLKMEI